MKRYLLLALLGACALLGPRPAYAGEWIAQAMEAVSVSSFTAVRLTSTTIPTPTPSLPTSVRAFITSETYDVRWAVLTSTNPTATFGHVLPAGGQLTISGYLNVLNARFMSVGASTATLQVTYEKEK